MTDEQRKRKNARTAKWFKEHPVEVKLLKAKWRAAHPGYNTAASTKWHKAHPEAKAKWYAKQPGGLTGYSKVWHKAKLEQKAGRPKPGICDVCEDSGRICFDHCHKFDEFRGWLCNGCNTALGYAEDSVQRLKYLIRYIERASPTMQVSIKQAKLLYRPKRCEACRRIDEICFDHDHKTGKFRGWLCHKCNITLGRVKDSVSTLLKLIAYLEQYEKRHNGHRQAARRHCARTAGER